MSVAIIGGGIIGLCAAYELSEGGTAVTVVNEGGPDDGCSIGNAGMIVPSHFDPISSPGMLKLGIRMMTNPTAPFGFSNPLDVEVAKWSYQFLRNANVKHVERTRALIRDLNLASRNRYLDYSSRLKTDIGLNQDGLLMLCRTEEALAHEAAVIPVATELGLNARLLDATAVQVLNPEMPLSVTGALHFVDDAQVTPAAVIRGLRAAILANGGNIFDHQRICRVIRRGNRITGISSETQNFPADEFVLAAGNWSGSLAKSIGLNLPILGGKGYGFTLKSPQLGVCAILTEDRVAVSPMLDGMRVTGTMEMGPMSPSINEARLGGIYAALPRYFPAIDVEEAKRAPLWSGYRPCPPDGLPYIGRTRQYNNLTIATGHGMMGLSLGPITGHLVHQVICGSVPDISLDMFHPDRFN